MQDNGNLYNNADSFAILFDEAWKKNKFDEEESLTSEEKIKKIIKDNKDHPFIKNYPSQALSVAKFRLRLLKLE